MEAVVDFYEVGGGNDLLKDTRLKPLGLVPSEKSDLIAYLEAMSGASFDTDEYVWREDDYDYAQNDPAFHLPFLLRAGERLRLSLGNFSGKPG